MSRKQFLRGDFSGRKAPLRPPWALPEEAFTRLCERCGDCIRVCPTQLLKQGRGGFPEPDFSAAECLFCEDCVGACRPRALRKEPGQRPWTLQAVVDAGSCIAFRGVACRSCVDPCESRAIRMPPRPGGISVPEIDAALCSGCGACYGVCPVGAIRMQAA
ncbi:MAG TPA: ferredoxin-type protein NapF [Gammaproteobacteria bacterium]|nr:ferredoxin-type protein NapF [Gammaproteobacteria bacterium]